MRNAILSQRPKRRVSSRWIKQAAMGITGFMTSLVAQTAQAQDGMASPMMPAINSGDTAWLLTATALVLMMTIPGVALFYGGMVRKTGVLAMCVQVFAVCCLASILWMIAGYSLAFGEGNAYIGDLSNLFLANVTKDAVSGTIPETVFVTFQMTFAIITPALILGGCAERMKFSSLLIFLGAWLLLVYAPICHWVWGGGFLGADGVLDFAGGTVVHINSGIAGLVAAIMVGARHGYKREPLRPHNLGYSLIGASLLWVGWFGFNAGSAVAADGAAGMAMLVTQIASAAGALAWMGVEWMLRGKPSLLGILSGAIAGLVAITPAAGFVDPMGSLWIGLAAGALCFWASVVVKNKLGYDDSLDVFGIHGVGGIVGAVLTGVFAVESIGGTPGFLEGNPGQVWIQIEGIIYTILYCAVVSFILLFLLKKTIGLRVEDSVEIEGLDLHVHGEKVDY